MSDPTTANNPVLLLLVLCATGFAFAPLTGPSFHLRLAVALTTISTAVVVLCQYQGPGNTVGSLEIFFVRVAEVSGVGMRGLEIG